MNIPAPDTTVGQLKVEDKVYSAESLSSTLSAAAKIQSMTQEQYDSMSEHDENTIYVIVNN